MNFKRSEWALSLVLVLGLSLGLALGASPGSEAATAWVQDRCDQDGDGFIKNTGGCKKKNPGVPVDCDDTDPALTNNCGGGATQLEFTAVFTEGAFQFDGGSVTLIVNADGSSAARSTHDVTLSRPLADGSPCPGDPGGQPCSDVWDAVFAFCSDVLALPLYSIDIDPGRFRLDTHVGELGIGLNKMEVQANDGSFVELSVNLRGMYDSEIVLGTPDIDYLTDRFYLVTGRLKGSGGGKKRCLSSDHPLFPLTVLRTAP